MNTKTCLKCNKEKELDLFYNYTRNKDGKEPYCKECTNKRTMKWARDNSEKTNLIHKKYKSKHRDKYNKLSEDYLIKHKFKDLACNCNTRAKQKKDLNRISAWDLWKIAKKQRLICPISGIKLTNENISPDHILAYSKGGTNSIENIQLVHKTINFMKTNHLIEDFLKLIETIYWHQASKRLKDHWKQT